MGKASKQAKVATPPRSKTNANTMSPPTVKKELIEEHLPPICLVFTVIACSGFLLMFSFRDVFATGRNIGGAMDEAYLVRGQ